jgi:hypothetical protein
LLEFLTIFDYYFAAEISADAFTKIDCFEEVCTSIDANYLF